jgi:NADPH:quinone reductase-like Zn-dependent oxidoreductase
MTTTKRAAVLLEPGKGPEITKVEVNHPAPGKVLVQNHAVALQPLDAKMLIADCGPASSLKYLAVLGSSGADLIQELGEGVTGLYTGDRIVFDTKASINPDQNREQRT